MDIIVPKSPKKTFTPQEIIDAAVATKNSGQLLCFINDYDNTVSDIHYGDGVNPFLTRIFPPTASALSQLERKGAVIGAISNRSGEQVAKRYQDQGISNPFTIGTYGMELYTQGASTVDERYQLYHQRITEISGWVRDVFIKYCEVHPDIKIETEMVIRSKFGEIYIENKGISPYFPQGLSQVYNLNNLSIDLRKALVDWLLQAYKSALTQWEQLPGEKLNEIWGAREFGKIEEKNYSWSLSPLLQEGKLFGVTKLLNEIEKFQNKPIGFVLYGGDENADAEAMLGLHQIQALTERNNFYVFGAWVNPGEERTDVKEACDIEVNGVQEYSDFLTQITGAI